MPEYRYEPPAWFVALQKLGIATNGCTRVTIVFEGHEPPRITAEYVDIDEKTGELINDLKMYELREVGNA